MEKHHRKSPSDFRLKKQYSIFDAKYLWQLFTKNKKWFAMSVILCLFLAVAYVYLSRPSYNIVGKMMLIDRRQNNSSASASLALLNQLPSGLSSSLYLGRSLGLENERELLMTKLLAKDVVEELGLYTEYRLQSFLKSRLLYKTQPVNVKISPKCLQTMSENLPLKVYSINLSIDKSDASYIVEGKLLKGNKKVDIKEQTFTKLPAVLHTEIGDLTFTENILPTAEDRKPFEKDYRLKVTIDPPMMVGKQFLKRLKVASASKKATSILQISLLDESMMRGVDFVNGLVAQYNERSNDERREEAAKTDEFINGRLAKIDQELGTTDADWEKFKKQYQVMDPKVDAEEVMTKKGAYESQLVNFGIQEQLLDYLSDYVNDPANLFELIPVNVGVYSGDAVSMINQHNAQVTERNMLLKSVTEKSSQVQQITQLIRELHPTIQTALQRDRQSLAIRRRTVEQEYNRYKNRVGSAPEQERVLTDVSRQRNIKEGVFVSLLQKREEIAMELANTTDKGRLIDETQSLKRTKPRTKVALLMSLIMGLLLPYVFFFTRRSLKKTIESEVDLKVTTSLPLIGTVLSSGQGACDDAFRMIRNNILNLLGEGRKTILVTSANQGDGKTFCATHLAEAFTRMGEKTIVSSLQDILPAGVDSSIHPDDLLAHKDLHQKLACLRETYDIIILDGPEVDQTNESQIGTLADVTCFVCRPGKTYKAVIERLDVLKAENSLSSPCIVLNQKG